MKTLSDEQLNAIELAKNVNINTLYIYGEGGSGKSEVIKNITKDLRSKDYVLLAPTQSAAENVNGETIHSFFKIKPVINTMADKEEDVLSFDMEEIDASVTNGKIVIIDEASMLGERMLNKIISRITPRKLILVGDGSQLDPVKDSPVNWIDYTKHHQELTRNYRISNPLVQKIVTKYRLTHKIDKETPKDTSWDNTIFDADTIYIAHTNKCLSDIQTKLLGYATAEVGDVLLTFGGCDKSISRKVIKKGEMVLVPYFSNNDLVVVQSIRPYIKGLNICTIIRDDRRYPDFNQFDKEPAVMVGDYDIYQKIVKERFKKAQLFQKQMFKKYRVKAGLAFKNAAKRKLGGYEEIQKFTKLWREYFEIKNTPYARHQNFRTCYKVQGKSFKRVIIDWNDLPTAKHKYVAISRAREFVGLVVRKKR